MNEPLNEKELLRWALADQAFMEADALVQHVIETKIPVEGPLFTACIAGIAVCYCRPFMSANGLGSLPDEMKQFSGENYEQMLTSTHAALFEARNKFGAHFDRLHSEQLFKNGELKLPPSEVIVELGPIGCSIATTATQINPALLERAHGLFLFQRARVSEKLGAFGGYLYLKFGKPGEYRFAIPD